MTVLPEALARRLRMEEARRQTQRQLELIDRQITRRATALVPHFSRRRQGYRRGDASSACMVLERYRLTRAALTAERQPEIDALSRKLAWQDLAIAAHRERHLHARRARQTQSGDLLDRPKAVGCAWR